MSQRYYNTSIRNLAYRLRRFKDMLDEHLVDIVMEKEDVIVSAVVDDQLFRRGINGKGIKIWSYEPYSDVTIAIKQRKGQPTTRVTLRDTGDFHDSVHLVHDADGFYLASDDAKVDDLKEKYGNEILRLTNENLNRILKVHIRRELAKRLKQSLR